MTLIEQEQAELNRLMAEVERLQQSGHDERQVLAAVGGAMRGPRVGWPSRLRSLGAFVLRV